MEKKISILIKESKNGNQDSLLVLIQKFMPLINKYKRKLGYEDAENDLIEHFIVTIQKMPIMIESKEIKYMEVSIRHKYIQLSKSNGFYNKTTILLDSMDEIIKFNNMENLSIDMKKALGILSERERNILIKRYINGYSDDEIAQFLRISRQAVHKARKKALFCLSQYLEKEMI